MRLWVQICAVAAGVLCGGFGGGTVEAADIPAGKRIAQAHCAECHALDAGPSPLADAPPFPTLHTRIKAGSALEDLLTHGMIAPSRPLDEGAPPLHPRMPQARLDDDEISDLVGFLKSIQQAGPLRR